jgi:hypothetical protein
MVAGSAGIYALLFAVGNFIYGKTGLAIIMLCITALASVAIKYLWPSLGIKGAE